MKLFFKLFITLFLLIIPTVVFAQENVENSVIIDDKATLLETENNTSFEWNSMESNTNIESQSNLTIKSAKKNYIIDCRDFYAMSYATRTDLRPVNNHSIINDYRKLETIGSIFLLVTILSCAYSIYVLTKKP